MRILHLTLKKKWFDLILSGEKKYEYREMKPYWAKRLKEGSDSGAINFDEIHFRNGYGKTRPFMRVQYLGTLEINPNFFTPECGEPLLLDRSYFQILLGDVISTTTYKKE